MLIHHRVTLGATLALAGLAAAPGAAAAQNQVVDYVIPGVTSNYAPVPGSYGDAFDNVSLTFRGLAGWGGAASTGAVFKYWTTGYGTLNGVGWFEAVSGTPTYSVGEMAFAPDAGKQVTITALDIAGYSGVTNGRKMQFRVYDWAYGAPLYESPIFTHLGSSGPLSITSAAGLRLQWSEVNDAGTPAGVRAFDTAVDNVKFTIADVGAVSSVPEPSTVALLAGGLAALGVAARRRRRDA